MHEFILRRIHFEVISKGNFGQTSESISDEIPGENHENKHTLIMIVTSRGF